MTRPECFLTSLSSFNFRWGSRAVPFLPLGGPLSPQGSTCPAFFETLEAAELFQKRSHVRIFADSQAG